MKFGFGSWPVVGWAKCSACACLSMGWDLGYLNEHAISFFGFSVLGS